MLDPGGYVGLSWLIRKNEISNPPMEIDYSQGNVRLKIVTQWHKLMILSDISGKGFKVMPHCVNFYW